MIDIAARRPTAIAADPGKAIQRLHLCNGLDPVRDGGMVPSILGMVGALVARGEDMAIVTPTPSNLAGHAVPVGCRIDGPEPDLERRVRSAELVHLHGLWQGHTRRGAAEARRRRIPYLITAHGMAEPWALRQKLWRKRAYLAVVERKNLQRADCLHALSRPEIEHLRAIAPRATVCYVPNGVDLSPFDDPPSRAELEAEHPELKGKFTLLFLSRLHKKKGLDLLVEAFARLAPRHPEVHLLVAGNDGGALEPFVARAGELGLLERITLLGHVAGPRARRVWAAADAFILPSYSEGFSMAVLEALAARRPTIITTSCHFPELDRARAGVTIEPTIDEVERGIAEILAMSPARRSELGERGRALVERDYTWDRQAAKLADVYRWMLDGGERPTAIREADA